MYNEGVICKLQIERTNWSVTYYSNITAYAKLSLIAYSYHKHFERLDVPETMWITVVVLDKDVDQ